MVVDSKYSIEQTIKILIDQVDPIPPNWYTRIKKTTRVCGNINTRGFEFRNNIYHMYSARAVGVFKVENKKTKLLIEFKKPPFPFNIYGNLMFRYKQDEKTIMSFLHEWL